MCDLQVITQEYNLPNAQSRIVIEDFHPHPKKKKKNKKTVNIYPLCDVKLHSLPNLLLFTL